MTFAPKRYRHAEEKSLFIGVFGDYPIIRIFDFLITYREFDYSKKDISNEAGVSWNTLLSIWDHLVERGLIKRTRKVGKQELFQINTKNDVVIKLLETYDLLIKQQIDSYAHKNENEDTRKALDLKYKTAIVGIGGAGSNIVNDICNIGIYNLDYFVINTDERVLKIANDKIKKILIGQNITNGHGAEGDLD